LKALLFNIQKFSLHDGPGIRTTLFFKGCNLRCKWCSNPESQPMEPQTLRSETAGRYYTLEEIMSEVLKDKPFYDESGGGVTLSGGEPLLQAEFAFALSDALHNAGVSAGLETAACVPEEVFKNAAEKFNFILFDLKHWEEEKLRLGTGADFGLVLKNLKNALSGSARITVRIPVIPGYNDSEEDARGYAKLLLSIGAKDVHILPFHQMGESKYRDLGVPYEYAGVPQLHDGDLEEYAGILKNAGLQVQTGG
jgi:pyruvate formate lyase activating enzyme